MRSNERCRYSLVVRSGYSGRAAVSGPRLAELKVELDRCSDLLRQREAHEVFQLDPDQTSVRDADTVEGYEQ